MTTISEQSAIVNNISIRAVAQAVKRLPRETRRIRFNTRQCISDIVTLN